MLSFGGGVQSTSVAEVPENITKMIKNNYKKIAIIEPNQVVEDLKAVYEKNYTIPVNVAFKFTKFVAFFDVYYHKDAEYNPGVLRNGDVVVTEKNTNYPVVADNYFYFKTTSYNSNSITIYLNSQNRHGAKVILTRIIAIE